MTTRTFDVEHEGTHYPTDAQMKASLRAVLKDEDLKLAGDPEFLVVENTSGGPSKVRATFDTEDATAETQKTKTVGVKKTP